ncbi:MAG: hypothetical protein IH819_00715 [Bacteroidetes bacterium]|nr:hypothetical protein [Bacteroidota bacterium]
MSGSVWNKLFDDPMVWRISIGVLHNRAKDIISICKGRVSKTIGDCVMAYFLGKNHKENAYLCAISLLETFFLLKRCYEINGDTTMFRFPITVGVSSGPFFFLKRKDPFGLPVDLAARFQGLANAGEIVMFKDSFYVEDKDIAYMTKAYERKQELLEVKTFGKVEV